uniref:Ankyrin repeat domain 45 n=1 Tax=Poecilia formosa TaxID=48698 RepID=A0A087XDP2_POEFO
MGRNALLVASMLGKSSVVRELVKQGAKLDEQTVRGYTSLHLAACWGHLDTVKTLLELGADLKAKTFREESPLDLAKRYSQTDCIDHLTLAGESEETQLILSCTQFIGNSQKPNELLMETVHTVYQVISVVNVKIYH